MSPLAPPYLPYLIEFTNESNHNNTDVSWLTKHSSLFNINSLLLLFCSTCSAHSSVPQLCCSVHILSIRSPFLSIVLLLIRFNLLCSAIFSFVYVIFSLPPHHRSTVLYLRFISVYILMLSMLILWQFVTQSSFYSTQQILLRTATHIKSAFIYIYYIHRRFSFSQNHYRKQLQTLHLSSNSKQEIVIHFLISLNFFSSLNSSYSHVKRQLHHAEIPTATETSL